MLKLLFYIKEVNSDINLKNDKKHQKSKQLWCVFSTLLYGVIIVLLWYFYDGFLVIIHFHFM